METNTFSATTISMADYNLEDIVPDLNLSAPLKLPERLSDEAMKLDLTRFDSLQVRLAQPIEPHFLQMLTIRLRNISFDQLVEAYYQQVDSLVKGGVDILLPETTFDTLNLKAAIFAIENFFENNGKRLPVILSLTITDASGRDTFQVKPRKPVELYRTCKTFVRRFKLCIGCR